MTATRKYYSKKKFTLYNGDCIEILKLLPIDSVNMIFADPPYFLSNGSFTCHAGKRVSVKKGDWDLGGGTEKNLEFHIAWLKACKRVLKPNGTYHSFINAVLLWKLTGIIF
ncbi:hypothetical protein AGMMS5026_06630 [Endomicrobiia bacterium]|nr:hypothetical protein AGMMS49523_02700 [Endomicrobiia bacterium]GHT11999.1 hypothetical protein AGMMS49571_03210 [Endomicrobiia bacterium]GHT20944.1 hypothetical protein AGMMS49929_08760 [Endomicrobiia bacterium]GHT25995.1 hypothetical protein AGMMS49995_01510 [Endomicrobiia bacterium]GHT31007.1 hypothetical protein AGMMS5026_06630 [Endomicrobiia bacterium]